MVNIIPDGSDLLALLCGVALGWLVMAVRYRLALGQVARRARGEALKKSGAVLKGQAAEQLAPLTGEFPYLPADARFLGSPIDYLIFEGLSEGQEVEVVFLEVKTGGSKLSARERRVREAVENGRCRWQELRL